MPTRGLSSGAQHPLRGWARPWVSLPTSYADPGGGAITDPEAGPVPEAEVLGCSFRTGL